MGRCRDRSCPAQILINPSGSEQTEPLSHPPYLSSWLLQAEQTQNLLLNLPFCPPAELAKTTTSIYHTPPLLALARRELPRVCLLSDPAEIEERL